MLLFPSQDRLLLALTSGTIPSEVRDAPALVGFGTDGSIHIQPSIALPRGARAGLKRLGVRECGPDGPDDEPGESVTCWPQILPLRRDVTTETPGPATPVFFEMPGDLVPDLASEIFRQGNDRQSIRWLTAEGRSEARALLRVIGPPYYTLLRALDRAEGDDGPRAYLERAPRVLVEVGYTHPLLDWIQPPTGTFLLMGSPRRWQSVEEGKFRDLYEMLDCQLPTPEVRWQGTELSQRLIVPLRLARGGSNEVAELWVIRERAGEQLDELVRHADDRLLARLAFAVAEEGGQTTVVVRARPSKQAPPVLVLEGVGYRPFLRLPNLFLPVGSRLHPPLRRDAVNRLLASDASRITWLAPVEGGGFVPESMPEDAFRPIEQWVDYVIDREQSALEAWVESARFDFEPFVCRDDLNDDPMPGPGRERKRRKRRNEEEVAEEHVPTALLKAAKLPNRKDRMLDVLPWPASVEPDEAVRRLGELESRFLELEAALDADERRPLWAEMAALNGALERAGDAAVCWANALWEGAEPPAEWVGAWARAEAGVASREIADLPALDQLLGQAKPSGADVRTLATTLLRAADNGLTLPGLATRLDRVTHFLEHNEATVPVRVAWLAWSAVYRLSGGDVLALARARDRTLERLHEQGLSRDLDLPSFLRFSGGGSSERGRQVRDALTRLRESSRFWIEKGRWVGPYTASLSDLMFAYGLARLGDIEASSSALQSGLKGLRRNEPVVGWLGKAFDYRIRQALEGKALGPLPDPLMNRLERMGQVGTEEHRKSDKTNRYKIDRLREHSRILEPHEKINPYRHWHGNLADDVTRELAQVVDLTDRDALTARMARLLALRPEGSQAATLAAKILATALEVAYRLGEAFARDLFDRVVPTVDRLDYLDRQAELLERAIYLAAHFDQDGHVRAYVGRFDALLADADERWVPTLEPLLGQCFRGLRKLGLRDEIDRLLDRIAALILRGRGVESADELAESAVREGPEAVAWSKSLRLLLHVAAGWSYFGQHDRALPVFDEARLLLLQGDLPPIEQTKLACGYVRSLGLAPIATALPRVEEVFARLERVHDTLTVGSHYSVSRLDLIEAVILTLVSDDFTLGESGRRWLEDDEYFVRRRIHRDVRSALGLEA